MYQYLLPVSTPYKRPLKMHQYLLPVSTPYKRPLKMYQYLLVSTPNKRPLKMYQFTASVNTLQNTTEDVSIFTASVNT